MARQPKSGTSKQRKEKRAASGRKTPFVDDQVRAKVEIGLKLATQLSKYSHLSLDTREEMLFGLIQQHGAASCTALIVEAHALKNRERLVLLEYAGLRALSRQRKLREAKQMLVHLSYSPMQRMWAYTSMACVACPEDKEQILTWMRAIAERMQGPIQSFDARFYIGEATLDHAEYERLTALFPERCDIPQIGFNDIQIMIQFASYSDDHLLLVRVIKILEERCFGAVAEFGETDLWMCLMGYSRSQLEQLAAELPTSRYLPKILQIANEMRDPQELSALEQEELVRTSSG